jgi:hypothetical protein
VQSRLAKGIRSCNHRPEWSVACVRNIKYVGERRSVTAPWTMINSRCILKRRRRRPRAGVFGAGTIPGARPTVAGRRASISSDLCCSGQRATDAGRSIGRMANIALYEFIGANRDELIRRCRAKVAERSAPPPTEAEIDHGVPLFLDQLCEELRHGPSQTHEISNSAMDHGHDLLLQGLTISQVVHDYGDVCQSITDLAVELGAPISADDFRTLNRCLDDAIAGAVTEYAQERDVSRDGESHELNALTKTAVNALAALRIGNVGVRGSTGDLLNRTLLAIRAVVLNRPSAEIVRRKPRT